MTQPRYRIYGELKEHFKALLRLVHDQEGRAETLFHAKIRKSLRCDFVNSVPMARMGIYLCLKYYIKPGQKVLLSPYTIADVVNMVILAGGIPDFVDIELNQISNEFWL